MNVKVVTHIRNVLPRPYVCQQKKGETPTIRNARKFGIHEWSIIFFGKNYGIIFHISQSFQRNNLSQRRLKTPNAK